MYRMDVTLVGHNPHAQIIADEPLDYTEHYYTPGTCQEDATVYTYQKITFKDIYPHIDWVLYIKDQHMEYDFIVHPGGNPTDIQVRYDGATDLKQNKEGNIVANTPYGKITEGKPIAYRQEDGTP